MKTALLSTVLLAYAPSAQAENTAVRASAGLRRNPDCTRVVSRLETGLDRLGAEGGRAQVGYLPELSQMLIELRMPAGRARQISGAVTRIRALGNSIPGLGYTVQALATFERTQMLLVCVLSGQCNLGTESQNHVLFTRRGGQGIIITPATTPSDPNEWAASFVGTAASLAGEQVLLEWLRAGYALERLAPGLADEYYRRFAGNYDGEFPPSPESLPDGFALVFMTLYQNLVTQNVFAHLFPARAAQNQAHLAEGGYQQLVGGTNATATRPVAAALGLSVAEFFPTARALFEAMDGTIRQAPERN